MGGQKNASEMKLRKVKTQIVRVSHFAEKGKGAPAILRACTGSSMAGGGFH